MLDTFRQYTKSTGFQIVVGLISLGFALQFGPGSRGCRTQASADTETWAAKVNGQVVPASLFNSQVNQNAYYLKLRNGGKSLSMDDLRSGDVRKNAMNSVVERELVLQAAQKHGISVSDDDVLKEIEKTEAFKKNGVFNAESFKNYVVNNVGTTPAKFEARMRDDLMIQRMMALQGASVFVSADEIQAEYVRGEEAASMEYVRFVPSQFVDQVTVSDADADALIAAKTADIQKKYDSQKFLYTEPRGIRARRLFVPLKADATPEEDAAAKKKMDQAAADLKAGKKWEELAAQFPDDPARQSSGDLGYISFNRSSIGKSAEEAVFKLKIGENSDVVRDRFGYQILNALEDRPAQEKSFDAVKRDIARDMAKEEKAKELAKKAAEETLAKLKTGASLSAQWPRELPAPSATPEESEKPTSTESLLKKPQAMASEEFHAYGGSISGVGLVPKVTAAAFALSADKRTPDAVVEDQNAMWVFELKSRKRADLSKLDDKQKASLRERLEGQKKAELGKLWVEQLKKVATVEENANVLRYDARRGSADFSDDS